MPGHAGSPGPGGPRPALTLNRARRNRYRALTSGRQPDCYDAEDPTTMNLLAFLPILSLMMFVHELGHFILARAFGITVQEFGFGLPPRIWGFKHNGVIYSINWIPFGA